MASASGEVVSSLPTRLPYSSCASRVSCGPGLNCRACGKKAWTSAKVSRVNAVSRGGVARWSRSAASPSASKRQARSSQVCARGDIAYFAGTSWMASAWMLPLALRPPRVTVRRPSVNS